MYVGGIQMISSQTSLNLSPFMAIYDIVVPKENMLRQINELVDFSFILEELRINIALIMAVMQCLPYECLSIYY